MDELNEMQNTVHEYRKALERFADRTDAQTHEINRRGSGEEREKIAKMDADLDAAERLIQLRAQQKRIQELERAEYSLRAPSSKGDSDPSTAEYAQRWLRAVASGNQAELRALSLSSSNAGIPTDMERRIVERLRQANVMRQLGVVTSIDSKRTITVENALPTTALVAEAGSISASDPTFSTAISVVPYKLATRVTMSQEFIEDAIGTNGIGGGLDYVANRCGLSIGLKMEEYMTTGTGSSEPQGILAASGGITQIEDIGAGGAGNSANDDLTGDMLINCVHRIAPQYRSGPRFSWVMHDSLVQCIRKIKVNTTDYVWKPSDNGGIADGVPGTIYGIPYRINAYAGTASATTNGTFLAAVGNFEYFGIFDRTGITSMIDPYSAASTHQVNLYMYSRFDSKILLPEAFAAITV